MGKTNPISVQDKQSIANLVKKGTIGKRIAAQFSVSEATVTRIRKGVADAKTNHDVSKAEKVKKMDHFLSGWVQMCRDKGFPITGPIICEKAIEINNEHKIYE